MTLSLPELQVQFTKVKLIIIPTAEKTIQRHFTSAAGISESISRKTRLPVIRTLSTPNTRPVLNLRLQ